jgi:hypothetical protein
VGTSLVSSVFFSVFSVMSFFKKISILCAAVQSKKLLLRRRAHPPVGPQDKGLSSPVYGAAPEVIGTVVLANKLSTNTPIIADVKQAYLDPANAKSFPRHEYAPEQPMLWTGNGYCVDNDKNFEFLKAHPDLDWSLNPRKRLEYWEFSELDRQFGAQLSEEGQARRALP